MALATSAGDESEAQSAGVAMLKVAETADQRESPPTLTPPPRII
jgi:hypothetical protein